MALTFPGGLANVNAEVSQIDNFAGLAANFTTVPAARAVVIAVDTQIVIFSSFTVDGQVTIDGELRVTNWPT